MNLDGATPGLILAAAGMYAATYASWTPNIFQFSRCTPLFAYLDLLDPSNSISKTDPFNLSSGYVKTHEQ